MLVTKAGDEETEGQLEDQEQSAVTDGYARVQDDKDHAGHRVQSEDGSLIAPVV